MYSNVHEKAFYNPIYRSILELGLSRASIADIDLLYMCLSGRGGHCYISMCSVCPLAMVIKDCDRLSFSINFVILCSKQIIVYNQSRLVMF